MNETPHSKAARPKEPRFFKIKKHFTKPDFRNA